MSTINVSNAAELTAALQSAQGGDTIRLAAGDYGAVSIRNIKPSAAVTIVAADPAQATHFDTLLIRDSENLVFRGFDIGRAMAPGEPTYTQLTWVRDSTRIVFDEMLFHGSMDGDPQNDGVGLSAVNVTGLVVKDSRFTDVSRGLVVEGITGLRVADNKFEIIRTDGMDVTGSSNVLIEDNLFQGFFAMPTDHPDAIQFHNVGQDRPTTDVTIRNNVLLPGGGYTPQGIWISDPGTGGYKNFRIENNLLYSASSYNGIGINGVDTISIVGNTVISPSNDGKLFWIRLRKSTNVDLFDNVSEDLLLESTTLTNFRQGGNLFLDENPEARLQFANLDLPGSAADLIMAGRGYQHVSPDGPAPVSSAIGSALTSMLSQSTGSSLGGQAILEAAAPETINVSALLSARPVAETAVVAEAAPMPVFEAVEFAGPGPAWSRWGYFDHHVALP